MDIYASDEEKVEALKAWWKENGRALILGVALGLAGVFGWRGWVQHQQGQAEQASALYAQVKTAVQQHNAQALQERAQRMFSQFGGSPYATLTALAAAKLEIGQDNLDAARGHLKWALEHADLEALRHVARIRLVRVVLEQGDIESASSLLSEVRSAPAFTADYEELRGDMYRARGQGRAAEAAYQKALSALPMDSGKRQLVRLKLQAVAGSGAREQDA